MNRKSSLLGRRTRRTKTDQNHYKVGEGVSGQKIVIHSRNGKIEAGKVVYRRKADYREDPYRQQSLI